MCNKERVYNLMEGTQGHFDRIRTLSMYSVKDIKIVADHKAILNAIRTVVSLGGQDKETQKYKRALNDNRKAVTKFGIFSGVAMGGIYCAMFAMYALGFFVGGIFINIEVNNPVTE